MTKRSFKPGFRLSVSDGMVVCVGAVGSWALFPVDTALSLGVAFSVAHFFLFCNVLRMARALELCWAGVFLLLSSATALFHLLSWSQTWVLAGLCTVVLTVIQVRRPSYHGMFWRQWNPGLPAWWERHGGQQVR